MEGGNMMDPADLTRLNDLLGDDATVDYVPKRDWTPQSKWKKNKRGKWIKRLSGHMGDNLEARRAIQEAKPYREPVSDWQGIPTPGDWTEEQMTPPWI
jgi:hypothetical protein